MFSPRSHPPLFFFPLPAGLLLVHGHRGSGLPTIPTPSRLSYPHVIIIFCFLKGGFIVLLGVDPIGPAPNTDGAEAGLLTRYFVLYTSNECIGWLYGRDQMNELILEEYVLVNCILGGESRTLRGLLLSFHQVVGGLDTWTVLIASRPRTSKVAEVCTLINESGRMCIQNRYECSDRSMIDVSLGSIHVTTTGYYL